MKHISVIGAGISGLSVANMLEGEYIVRLYERSSTPGGLVKCDNINGALFHRVGGHVFNSKNEVVLNWFWNLFDRDTEFIKAKRNAKILFGNTQVGYPLENNLFQLPEDKARAAILELLELQCVITKHDAENFKEFLENTFGKTLYDLYFGPYNSKVWNRDLSRVPMEWLAGKLPMPDKNEIILNNILRQEDTGMVHSFFYYAKNGGSQFIINRLAERKDIWLNYEVVAITRTNACQLIINEEQISDHIIYCGDVRQLHSLIQIDDDALKIALNDVKDLASNGTSNVLCETDETDLSWLYLPEKKYKAHRIIYTGNFSESNNGDCTRKTCVVEFSGKQTQENMIDELRELPGNLKALAFNYEPNSYIIHDMLTRKKIKNLKALLAKYHIYLLGRFAEWEYYNMDKCIESAMMVSKRFIS